MFSASLASARLEAKNNQGYGQQPLPHPRDFQISELLEAWMKLDAAARQTFLEGISAEKRPTLMVYAERMASMAVREGDQSMVVRGLLALSLNVQPDDRRGVDALLSLHYDAARRLAVEPSLLFEKTASLLPVSSENILRSFLRRKPKDQSLEAMGYQAGEDADGFRYRRTW